MEAGTTAEVPSVRRAVTAQSAVLLGVAGIAWAMTVVEAREMGVMPGTMGLGLAAFLFMWTPMMAAMMLPAAAPVAAVYARTVRNRRASRLPAFAAGYLAVWAAAGIPAYGLAWLGGILVQDHPGAARAAAVGVLALAGLYQLSPLKDACLRQCRSPLALFMRFASRRGRLRDLRVGLHHGAYCLGCCWPLFVVLIAVGVMNLAAMVAVVAVVMLEKLWSHGEAFSRVVGVAALALAVAAIWVPGLTPALSTQDHGRGGPAMERMTGAGEEMPPMGGARMGTQPATR
jgi:predicted metal-binding membrane protein